MFNFEEGLSRLMEEATKETPESRMLRKTQEVFESIDNFWRVCNEEVRGLLGSSSVDEMALYFPRRDYLFSFMAKAVRDDWVVFNMDEDEVQVSPINSNYGVEYWFLRKEGVPYRLEMMVVRDGFSPYHGALQEVSERHGLALVLAHASFKVSDEARYAASGVALRNAGYEVAQHCTSTYGRFSYYLNPERETMPPLKPRINVRDAGADSGN